MTSFATFAARGYPKSLTAARALAAEIATAAAANPNAPAWRAQINALTAPAKTLTAALDAIGSALLAFGVTRDQLAAAWPASRLPRPPSPPQRAVATQADDLAHLPLAIATAFRSSRAHEVTHARVRQQIDDLVAKDAKLLASASPAMLKAWTDAAFAYLARTSSRREVVPSTLSAQLSAAPASLDHGECEAYLVVGGGPRPTGSRLSALPASTPSQESAVQRQLAEHAATHERIEADKAARFSRNWGDERTARHVKLIETYLSLPLGTAERQKFFAENERELWQAQKTVLHLEATRRPAK